MVAVSSDASDNKTRQLASITYSFNFYRHGPHRHGSPQKRRGQPWGTFFDSSAIHSLIPQVDLHHGRPVRRRRRHRCRQSYNHRQLYCNRSSQLFRLRTLTTIFPQANRVTDKLTHVHDRIYCCRSGSAADTQAVADIVHFYLQMFTSVPIFSFWFSHSDRGIYRQTSGAPPSVHTAAALFQKLCYENKDALSAGIIVAGWDKDAGPSVYNIPVGGGMFRQPWAIGGVSCPLRDKLSVTYRF